MVKKNIHPLYFETKIICTTCNTEFCCGSTKKEEIKIDTCSSCHPFYTGNQQFSNSAGRVEKFRNKFIKKNEIADNLKKNFKKQKEINKKEKK